MGMKHDPPNPTTLLTPTNTADLDLSCSRFAQFRMVIAHLNTSHSRTFVGGRALLGMRRHFSRKIDLLLHELLFLKIGPPLKGNSYQKSQKEAFP
jgi:hypothetical protein